MNESNGHLPKTLDLADIYNMPSDEVLTNQDEIKEEDATTMSVWCEECEAYNIGECFIHGGDMVVAHDNELPSRAVLSLPKILSLKAVKSKSSGDQLAPDLKGIVAKKVLKARTQFGPMEGVVVPNSPANVGESMEFGVTNTDGALSYLSLTDESQCNWMMFVRPAKDFDTQNLAAFLRDGAVYFVTIKNINAGTELLVWYSAPYAKLMGKEILVPQNRIKVKRFALNHDTLQRKDKESIPSLLPTTIQTQKETPKDTVTHQANKRRNVARSPNRLLECHICGTKFARVSQKINHYCKAKNEEEGNDMGTRRRKGRPRKVVNGVLDQSGIDDNLSVQFTDSNVPDLPIVASEDITKILGNEEENEKGILDSELNDEKNIGKDILSDYTIPAVKKENITNSSDTAKKKTRDNELEADIRVSCEQCSFTSNSLDIMDRHKVIHTKAVQYTCGIDGCKKVFTAKFKFLRHLNVHSKAQLYKCNICDSTYSRSDHLKNHMAVHACNRTQYSCDICGKSYLYKSTLMFHKARHEAYEGTSMRCLVCEKKFSTQEELKAHINIHNRYKPDNNKDKMKKCPQCDKTFPSQKDVRRHLITHSKERAFLCEHCPQTFIRKDHLRRHYLSHHKKEIYEAQIKTSKYGCPVCLKVFKKKEFMDYHMRDLHPNGIQEIEPIRKPRMYKEKKVQTTSKSSQVKVEENLLFHTYKPQTQLFPTPGVLPIKPIEEAQQRIHQHPPPLPQQKQLHQPPSQYNEKQTQVMPTHLTQACHTAVDQDNNPQTHQALESDADSIDFTNLSKALGLQPVHTTPKLEKTSSQIAYQAPVQQPQIQQQSQSHTSPVSFRMLKSLLKPHAVEPETGKTAEQIIMELVASQPQQSHMKELEQKQQQQQRQEQQKQQQQKQQQLQPYLQQQQQLLKLQERLMQQQNLLSIETAHQRQGIQQPVFIVQKPQKQTHPIQYIQPQQQGLQHIPAQQQQQTPTNQNEQTPVKLILQVVPNQEQQQQQQQKQLQQQQQKQKELQQQEQQKEQQQKQPLSILGQNDKSRPLQTPTPSSDIFPNNILSLMSATLEEDLPTKNIEWSLSGDPNTNPRNKPATETSSSSGNEGRSFQTNLNDSNTMSVTTDSPLGGFMKQEHSYVTHASSSQTSKASLNLSATLPTVLTDDNNTTPNNFLIAQKNNPKGASASTMTLPISTNTITTDFQIQSTSLGSIVSTNVNMPGSSTSASSSSNAVSDDDFINLLHLLKGTKRVINLNSGMINEVLKGVGIQHVLEKTEPQMTQQPDNNNAEQQKQQSGLRQGQYLQQQPQQQQQQLQQQNNQKLKQEPPPPPQNHQQQQQQQQSEVVGSLPLGWLDSTNLSDYSVGDLALGTDGSLISGGITPMANHLIIQVPVNVQDYPQIIAQGRQPSQQQHQIQQQHFLSQISQQQANQQSQPTHIQIIPQQQASFLQDTQQVQQLFQQSNHQQ